jgi:pilus assembly protein CpaB
MVNRARPGRSFRKVVTMKRTIVATIVAVVLALVGGVAVLLYARGADARAVAGREPVQVLVASKRIPAGTTGKAIVDGGYLDQVVMPAASVPGDSISSIDAGLETLVVTSDLQARQMVLRGAFGEAAVRTGGLAVPDGKVAVTVEIGDAARVAGHVEAGAEVAVFDTFTVAPGKGRVPAGDGLAEDHAYTQATRLLLPRVEVLAIGERVIEEEKSDDKDDDSKSAKTTKVMVTLAVSQAEAEKLVLATTTGSLYFALLSDASDVQPGAGVDNRTLFN